MMHSSKTFQIMREADCNVFENTEESMYWALRSQIIELILATDMSKHFELLGKIKAKIITTPSRPVDTPDHRIEVLKIAMKAADVGHAAKAMDLHFKWSALVVQEFFEQGDLEKEKGISVSMYCDREKTDIAKSQIGFIRNIVLPIYESLNKYLICRGIENECVKQLKNNCAEWEKKNRRRLMTDIIPEVIENDLGGLGMRRINSLFRNSSG